MPTRRIIAVSPDPALRDQLVGALAGPERVVVGEASTGALPTAPIGLAVIHLGEVRPTNLPAVVAELPPATPVIAILPRTDLVGLVDLMRAAEHVVAVLVADGLDLAELGGLATRVLDGERFGLAPFVTRAGELHETRVGDYAGKAACIDAVLAFAEEARVRRKYRELIGQCLDEMLMNALYDAPVDDEGRPLFADVAPSERKALPHEHEAVVHYACDGLRFAMAVRDAFGRLERATVLRYLHKCLHEEQQIDRKKGGAGLGLYLMASSASSVYFRVEPGRGTEVVCAFELASARPRLVQFGFLPASDDGALVEAAPAPVPAIGSTRVPVVAAPGAAPAAARPPARPAARADHRAGGGDRPRPGRDPPGRDRRPLTGESRYNQQVVSTIHTQLLTDDASGALVERTFRLRVVGGPDQGKEHTLDEGTTMVGTHADNDLVLTDTTVSRYHLEIRVRRDGIEVRDLDTTNGTKHGGVRLGSVVLTGGARLRLGKHTELDVEPVDTSVSLSEWPHERFGDVLGTTPAMKRLFALLHRAAPTDATVLLQGETGTGKEALAEAVHRASRRAKAPFVVVDCGSIPRDLIASELFGHARGAFTGAAADKAGMIEAADGGTLFLDEIGELALDLQPQLLRVLDRRQVRRVGETTARDVDLRVIAATHRDLRQMVREGTFREDLYYRLAVVATMVPPLRERTADIPALAAHFADRMGRGGFTHSPALLEQLARHAWPGNVRELRNVVERALSLGDAALADLAPGAGATPDPDGARRPANADVLELPFKEAKAALVESFERDYLVALLARHRGNISRAATEAGIDRNYIHRLVKKYGLEVERG